MSNCLNGLTYRFIQCIKGSVNIILLIPIIIKIFESIKTLTGICEENKLKI